ncbi:MAG TPA: tRNA (guanosine(37)-N1)-methyltransferase TrmD [Opitutae bacterium]|nr:tRNA (guanosine(37)-N1)-methyltransferase TrmD [Opitutae bacterium]
MPRGLHFDIITIFPEMLDMYFRESILGRAQAAGLIHIAQHDLRQWSQDKHNTVDDRPFGGGAGMLLKPEPLFEAVDALKKPTSQVIYLSPDGELLSDALVKELSHQEHLILISGHYEGIDQRVRDHCVDREVSIGDYVLTNGTLPAAILVDAVSRQIPGVLGEEKSLTQDAFAANLLSFPQYTRPAEYRGYQVPEVLVSGNHEAIAAWRKEQQVQKTQDRRPDLLK